MLVDIYPAAATAGRPTSSSRTTCRSGTGNVKAPLPAYSPVVHTGGLTFRVKKKPNLHLAEPASMVVDVTDADGKPVKFTPFYGALAHAIFFRNGTLDYFHSHICGNDPACSAGFGTAATTGHSTKPGQLELGVLLPATGKWRLFLQVTHGRQALDSSVYPGCAMKHREHLAGLLPGLVLVVLGGRALAYAATPTPLAGQLGGPRLPVIAFVAMAVATVLSLGVLWLAALGVRERHALELARRGPAPRLALAHFGVDACVLGGSSLLAFAAIETWMHSRAWACTCRGGSASRGPSTATRSRSCSLSHSPPRRCSPPCATRSPGRAASSACCGACCSRARRSARRFSPPGTRPSWRGCWHGRCVRAGRPRSPSCSHCQQRRARP